MRQARIGGAHGGDQRVHHLGLDAIGEVARIGDVPEAAPAIRDLLVLGERVGDQRELAQIVLEYNAERLRGLFARLLLLIL